jgi:hypothetical protein
VATLIQDKHRGNHDRNQRWARVERADLFARYGALHTQGVSQRQAAKVLEVPRSTLQAWRAYQEHLDERPTVVAFFHSVPGLAFLHRFVIAFHVVCVEIGACGMRLACLVLELTGLNRCVGASYGTQHQVNCRVEQAIVAYRHEERVRLAREMPAQDLALTQDGGLSLGGIEPVSTDILLEPAAQTRDHDTWQTLMEQALAGRNGRVIPSTSDEAPGLLASVAQPLGAHHSPDLFHVQHELRKAVSAPMAVQQRAAAKVVVQAEETLHRVQERVHTTPGEPDKRGPGHPPKAIPCLEQVAQEVEAARQEHQRLSEQRKQVTQRMRAIGHAYHCVDLERGVRRNGKRIAGDIQHHIDTIRTIAQQAGRSETCLKRIAQAERMVPKMQATIAFVSG